MRHLRKEPRWYVTFTTDTRCGYCYVDAPSRWLAERKALREWGSWFNGRGPVRTNARPASEASGKTRPADRVH